MVICLEWGTDLHMAQLMPLPLTVSCFSKIQIALTFLVPVVPEKGPLNWCVCVCVRACVCACVCLFFCLSDHSRLSEIQTAPHFCAFLGPECVCFLNWKLQVAQGKENMSTCYLEVGCLALHYLTSTCSYMSAKLLLLLLYLYQSVCVLLQIARMDFCGW